MWLQEGGGSVLVEMVHTCVQQFASRMLSTTTPVEEEGPIKKTSSGMLQKDKEHMSRKRKRRDS